MKQSDIKHVTEKLFNVLQDVEVKVALDALSRVTKEFERAQREVTRGDKNRTLEKSLWIGTSQWHSSDDACFRRRGARGVGKQRRVINLCRPSARAAR
jgi:hypothetical protein